MKIHSAAAKEDLYRRLRRIEGQTRGLQKMLDDDRDCREILQQLRAAQSAIANATGVFMHSVARDCLLNPAVDEDRSQEEIVDELLTLMAKVK